MDENDCIEWDLARSPHCSRLRRGIVALFLVCRATLSIGAHFRIEPYRLTVILDRAVAVALVMIVFLSRCQQRWMEGVLLSRNRSPGCGSDQRFVTRVGPARSSVEVCSLAFVSSGKARQLTLRNRKAHLRATLRTHIAIASRPKSSPRNRRRPARGGLDSGPQREAIQR